jgi:hypothetical protein
MPWSFSFGELAPVGLLELHGLDRGRCARLASPCGTYVPGDLLPAEGAGSGFARVKKRASATTNHLVPIPDAKSNIFGARHRVSKKMFR